MTKEVTITITAPVECTEEQFLEWVYFCIGYSACIQISNPLCDEDLNIDSVNIY